MKWEGEVWGKGEGRKGGAHEGRGIRMHENSQKCSTGTPLKGYRPVSYISRKLLSSCQVYIYIVDRMPLS